MSSAADISSASDTAEWSSLHFLALAAEQASQEDVEERPAKRQATQVPSGSMNVEDSGEDPGRTSDEIQQNPPSSGLGEWLHQATQSGYNTCGAAPFLRKPSAGGPPRAHVTGPPRAAPHPSYHQLDVMAAHEAWLSQQRAMRTLPASLPSYVSGIPSPTPRTDNEADSDSEERVQAPRVKHWSEYLRYNKRNCQRIGADFQAEIPDLVDAKDYHPESYFENVRVLHMQQAIPPAEP